MSNHPFLIDHFYTRKDIFALLGIPDPKGGNWYTGYTSHGDDWFIFCGVGTPGRTGHDYHNYFFGEDLVWFAKNGSKIEQNSIQSLINPKGKIFIFYREDNRNPFVFWGLGQAKELKDTTPVQITWALAPDPYLPPEIIPQEILDHDKVFEGTKKLISVNIYERNPNARRKCIAQWGIKCSCCSFDFSVVYGSIGEGFIQVHHLKPLSEIGEGYELDPITDLRPICPNCHAMLHRTIPPLSIEELQVIIRELNNAN